MSKLIASAAIKGAYKIVDQAEKKWQEAMDKWEPMSRWASLILLIIYR